MMGVYKHGQCGTPTYISWANMRQRCLDPNHPQFADYGGRGIGIDERWGDFSCFLADMGERPEGMTLERSVNSLGYFSHNCKWATVQEQNSNKRTSNPFTGVGYHTGRQEWRASITVNGVKKHIGQFKTNLAACYARWAYEREAGQE